ncbi:hypothetical protein BRC81_02840 [Halobacteriales archaeon QS_1_68_20]|nr:MAG: hypothetical protein BRC81_02840 [Halobacteriales archaeon QS_1_68_20]
MIDDRYDDHIAFADFVTLLVGTGFLVVAEWASLPTVSALAGLLVTLGAVLFLVNVVPVLRRHSPHSLTAIVFGTPWSGGTGASADGSGTDEGAIPEGDVD